MPSPVSGGGAGGQNVDVVRCGHAACSWLQQARPGCCFVTELQAFRREAYLGKSNDFQIKALNSVGEAAGGVCVGGGRWPVHGVQGSRVAGAWVLGF